VKTLRVGVLMRVSIIAAHDMNRVIGFEGKIPWYISADLKNFKNLTTGKAVIMGRKTFESIGKALPNRLNIVITSDPEAFSHKWIPEYSPISSVGHPLVAASSYEEALKIAKSRMQKHVFAIGGTRVYEEAIKTADDMYITMVYHIHDGDTYFPDYSYRNWELVEISEVEIDENDETPEYAFMLLKRRTLGFLGKTMNYLATKFPGVFGSRGPT
jgi:dihydrofolate reductase